MQNNARPLKWMGSSRRSFRAFPKEVRQEFGYGLFLVQTGQRPPASKILKGLDGGVVELIEDFDGDTYRAVYTVRLKDAIYVLHAFKKKSKTGIKTPQSDIDLIKQRLKDIERQQVKP